MAALAEEEPLAAVVANDKLASTCSTCFAHKIEQTLLRCTRCRVIHYCSNECQKKDWPNHKYECMFLEKTAPRVPPSMARLMCRVALKQSAGPIQPAFNGRTWDAMMDHKPEIQKDAEKAEFFVCISHILYQFMGPEMVPKPTELISSFGKIVINCFTITDSTSSNQSLGEGVYVGLSAQDHNCDPDCFIVFDGPKAILRSPRRDINYSTKLTISYTDLIATTTARQQALKQQYYFDCTCSLCDDKTRDFWGRSVYASCCPDGVCLFDPRAISLSCHSCGATSSIDPEDVELANMELDLFLNKDKLGTDLPLELQKCLGMYEKCKTILSSFNFLMADLAQRIQDLALELNKRHTCIQFATLPIKAYKRYLRPGHPELTTRLMSAAIADSYAEPPTGQTLELFQEAYDAALLSHGPRHQLTSRIDHLFSQYRIRLQRDLSC